MKRILNNAPKRNPPSLSPDKAEAKTVDQSRPEKSSSQSERFIAKARELGLDEREETFDAALKKVARHKPT